MPFDPFHTFIKSKKFWMAMATLLCMVTFVLCTGVGGDLSERLLNLFRGRGGNVVAKLDGRSIYASELHDLKDQRLLAEKVMRKAYEIIDRKIFEYQKEFAKRKELNQEEQKFRSRLALIKDDVNKRLAKKAYFDTGTKLEELVDFLMWKNLADRLNVELVEEVVAEIFYEEIFNRPANFFGDQEFAELLSEARGGSRSVTWGTVMAALRDEYRVRMAKLSYAEAQIQAYQMRRETSPPQWREELAVDIRGAVTPFELWDFYRKNRSEFDVALVPVTAQSLVEKIAKADKKDIEALLKDAKYGAAYKAIASPLERDLEFLYNERKTLGHDPSSEKNGLQTPHQVKVEYIVGDAQVDFYQKPAQVLSLCEVYPPAWAPVGSPLAAAIRYTVVPAAALQKQIDKL